MTPQQILELLSRDGIDLISDQGNLKVRSTKSKITDEQKSLILANKTILLAHLKTIDAPKCGSLEKSVPAPTVPSSANEAPPGQTYCKVYKLPNGRIEKYTKEEFDRVVEVMRLLHQQSLKLGQKGNSG